MFIVVVLAVIAAAYVSGKLKLNSYEEFYEESFDDADYNDISFDEYARERGYRKVA